MSSTAERPRGAHGMWAAGAAALVASLLGAGFWLGRQTGPAGAASSPSPLAPPLYVEQPAQEQTLDDRVAALEKRVENVRQQQSSGPRQALPASPTALPAPAVEATGGLQATRGYLQQVDEVVGGEKAIADPRPFASRLLAQGMSDEVQLDIVLARISLARANLRKVKPPPHCRDHHALLTSQLDSAAALLEEAQRASATGDTARLRALAEQADKMPAQTLRLQELDRALRNGS